MKQYAVRRTGGGTNAQFFDRIRRDAALSVICRKGYKNLRDEVSGMFGSITGTPTVSYNAYFGEAVQFDGGTNRLAYSNHPWAANQDGTFMTVCQLSATAANDSWLATRGASNVGMLLGLDAVGTGILRLTKGGVISIDSGITLSTGIPYFIAVSYRHSDGATKFHVKRLDTGANTTAALTNSSAYSAGDGTFGVGGDPMFGVDANIAIAAAYIGNRYLFPEELARWAEDPFGLWRDHRYTVGKAPAAAGGGFFSRYYYDMTRPRAA